MRPARALARRENRRRGSLARGAADALTVVLAARPQAVPNRRMVRLADEILGRDGRMIAVIEAHHAAWKQVGVDRAKGG